MNQVPDRFKRAVIKEPADPIVKKGKYPTLVNNLGYLNTVYCPRCGRRMFSYYDKDILPDGPDAFRMKVSHTVNNCSRCGLHLNLDRWKDPNDIDEDPNNLFYVPKVVNDDEDIDLE